MLAVSGSEIREDLPRYEKCKSFKNDDAYNKQEHNKLLHRTYDCAYFLKVTACSVAHPCGHRLAPGACRDEYYVGESGLDCCAADTFQAAIDIKECGIFYPNKATRPLIPSSRNLAQTCNPESQLARDTASHRASRSLHNTRQGAWGTGGLR
jgi:hypothetical protein